MGFFSRFSPVRAVRDLRLFLSHRQPYELGFLALSIAVTGFLIFAFARDSYSEKEYRPNITYVEQWRADRTNAEIIAQQRIDEPIRQKALAEQRRADEERRQSFQRLDKKLESWGL